MFNNTVALEDVVLSNMGQRHCVSLRCGIYKSKLKSLS